MRVEIIERKGNFLTVKVLDKLNDKTLAENAYKDRNFAYLDLWLRGTTTNDQRKHYFAILGDIRKSLNCTMGEARLWTYSKYLFDYDKKDIVSMSTNAAKKEDATQLIQACIDFAIEMNVTLNNDYSQYFTDTQFYALIMSRKCFVCGQIHADIHHENALGMGRNRKQYKLHHEHKLMALCRKHHNEAEQIGKDTFRQKYHVHGIKLSPEDLRKIGVM